MPKSVFILGLLRSGTTVLSDLLCSRDRSVVFSEPMLMHGWLPQIEVIPNTQKALGLSVAAPPERTAGRSPTDWFDAEVLPTLGGLQFWGMKEVHFSTAEALVSRYRPDHLLLTVRDPRDVFFSALDLINKALLVFPGGRVLRDEAWVHMRLRSDIRVLARLHDAHHGSLLRYEDQRPGDDWSDQVARMLGQHFELTERVALAATDRGRKRDEAAKHGMGLSFSSFFRWTQHADRRSQAIASWLWRDLEGLYAPFGYRQTADLADVDDAAISEIASDFTAEMAQMTRSPGVALQDEAQFLLSLRAGRRRLAALLPEGARAIELDPLTPGLKLLRPAGSYAAVSEHAGHRVIRQRAWREEGLAFAGPATHLVFNHVLEFDDDWIETLRRASAARKTIAINTFLAEERPPWWGEVPAPTVSLGELRAAIHDWPYAMRVSPQQGYGERCIVLEPAKRPRPSGTSRTEVRRGPA